MEASEDEGQPGHLLRKRLKCSDEAEEGIEPEVASRVADRLLYSSAALLTAIVVLDALEPDFPIICANTVLALTTEFRVDEIIIYYLDPIALDFLLLEKREEIEFYQGN
ncbi:flavin-binding [Striga asiatica]|uniref:Flavin-binding n=1 Tax=Striga asiatica TaxID=4170 RepID=A0A5A7QGT8_STRAF|nr:flavin-binding [Striga asiatica]